MGHEGDCRVVLIGMMGSGKSTVGRELAARTGWALHDNDALLERIAGRTARDLFEAHGEAVLREVEAAALALGLAQPPACIVTAAAGVILKESLRVALAAETVVWLRADPATLFRRATGGDHRPWLDHGQDWFATTAAARGPLYESVSDLIVDVDDATPAMVASEIHLWLSNASPCSEALAG